MSLSEQVTKRFEMLYDEIDSQMRRKSDSVFNRFTMESDDAKILNKFRSGAIPEEKIDELLNSAREFDDELKSFIERNNLRKKIATRKKKTSKSSAVPPIWNAAKLNEYIEGIVDEVFESCEKNVQDTCEEQNSKLLKVVPKAVPKPILKAAAHHPNRNVSTNVKFQVQPENIFPIKRSNKKVQAFTQTAFKLHGCDSSRTKSTNRHLNPDGSVDVDISENFKVAVKERPLPTLSNLKISPKAVTSTNERSTDLKQGQPEHDVVRTFDSCLATNDIEKPKQMTTQRFPVLSIKGSCSIQKIFQLEISPTKVTCADSFEPFLNSNTKFIQCAYETPKHFDEQRPVEALGITENPAVTIKNAIETSLCDAQVVNRILSDYGARLLDGKIHVVVENGRKRKKTKSRKSLKPSVLRKSSVEAKASVKQVADNETEEINICTVKAIPDETGGDKINEKDSSMSSSITDDGKIRQILNISRGDEKNRKKPRHDSSPESYPPSVNEESSFQPQTLISSVDSNFKSIYKMIEDTFETNLETEVTPDTNGSAREIGDGMKEMREIIKMSEENIKRAGMMLQKYQTSNQEIRRAEEFNQPTVVDEIKVSREIPVSTMQAKETCHQGIQASGDWASFETHKADSNHETLSRQIANSCAKTLDDKNVQTETSVTWKSPQYFESVFDSYSNFKHIKFNQSPAPSHIRHDPLSSLLNSCNCFGCESHRNSKHSRSPLPLSDFNISRPKLSPSVTYRSSSVLKVPYNKMYEGDEEVMEAANKFLRSVEKEKRRSESSVSSDSISSKLYSPQRVHSRRNSSSISTPSSSLINNVPQGRRECDQVMAARSRINLGDKLEEAADRVISVEEKLKRLKPFTGETNSNNLLSEFQQFDQTDSHEIDDFLDRYMSEGEVLSQGEIQLGLSDDDAADVDLWEADSPQVELRMQRRVQE